MKTIFNPNGRITRRKYLVLFVVFYFINLFCILQIYEAYLSEDLILFVISGIIFITTIVLLFVSSIKRLHDLGLDWKYALYLLIPPPINFIGFVWLSVKEGNKGTNQYGPDPREEEDLMS